MRRFGIHVGILVCFAIAALAQEQEDWRKLSGPEITDALIGLTLEYDNAWQDFRASGKTLYNAVADSWGNWRVENDQYCSQWPARDFWNIYDVAVFEDQVRFTGAYDDVSFGTIRK